MISKYILTYDKSPETMGCNILMCNILYFRRKSEN